MFLSAAYHTFGCTSEEDRQKWLKVDIFGISAGLLAMYLSGIYTAFFCHKVSTFLSETPIFPERAGAVPLLAFANLRNHCLCAYEG